MSARCSVKRMHKVRPVSPMYSWPQDWQEMVYIRFLLWHVNCLVIFMRFLGPWTTVSEHTCGQVLQFGRPQGKVPAGLVRGVAFCLREDLTRISRRLRSRLNATKGRSRNVSPTVRLSVRRCQFDFRILHTGRLWGWYSTDTTGLSVCLGGVWRRAASRGTCLARCRADRMTAGGYRRAVKKSHILLAKPLVLYHSYPLTRSHLVFELFFI